MGKARAPGAPKGTKNAYACFVETCRHEHHVLNPKDQVKFADFSRKCSEKWKAMTADQKKPFEAKAKDDKVRYEREFAIYKKTHPEAAAAKGGKRKGKDKDPNAPKKALSAFFHFGNEFRPKITAELQAKGPKPSVGDVAKKLGEKWQTMTDSDKKPYQRLNEKDKERYDKEMAAYKAKGGAGGSPAKKAKKAPVKEVSEEEDDDEESEEESEEESD